MPNGEQKDDDLSTRIQDLQLKRSSAKRKTRGQDTASGWARGSRMATDLVAGVIVGGFIGWWLDVWLGTRPWLFLVCLMFGFAAGIMNVVRSAQEMANANQRLSDADEKNELRSSSSDDEIK